MEQIAEPHAEEDSWSTLPLAGHGPASWLLASASKSHLRVAATFAGLVLVGWLPVGIAALEGGLFGEQQDMLYLSQDWGYFNQFCLALPLIAVFYRAYFARLPSALDELFAGGVFSHDDRSRESAREVRKFLAKPWLEIVPIAVAVAVFAMAGDHFFTGIYQSWHRRESGALSWAALAHFPLVILLYYIVAVMVVRLMTLYFVLRRLFQLEADIMPLHPDGCGGLAALGRSSLPLHICAFLFGGIVVIGVESTRLNFDLGYTSIPVLAMIGAYLLGMLAAFFAPLYPAHTAMRQAKSAMLDSLAREYRRWHRELADCLLGTKVPVGVAGAVGSDGHDTSAPNRERVIQLHRSLKHLRRMHGGVAAMPVWPFNLANLRRFFVSVGLPLVLYMVDTLLGRFW